MVFQAARCGASSGPKMLDDIEIKRAPAKNRLRKQGIAVGITGIDQCRNVKGPMPVKRLARAGLGSFCERPSHVRRRFSAAGVFFRRTPGPSSLPSRKARPAFSKARWSFARVPAIGIGAVLVAGDGVGGDAGAFSGFDDVPAQGGAGHAQLFAGYHGMFPLSH